MDVHFYPPQPGLEWLVIQYQTLQDESGMSYRDRHIPRGDSAIVVNLRGTVHSLSAKAVRLPEAFITTVRPLSVILENSGPLTSFIVVCRTSVLSRLLGIDLFAYRDADAIDLMDTPFSEWMNILSLAEERPDCSMFPSFLEAREFMTYQEDEIDEAYSLILQHAHCRSLQEILEETGISERSLRRHFASRVGVSPKTLLRIVRVNHVFGLILRQESPDFMEVVSECRYCDQSHFIKDFKAIVGETPHHFFHRNLGKVRFLSGKP